MQLVNMNILLVLSSNIFHMKNCHKQFIYGTLVLDMSMQTKSSTSTWNPQDLKKNVHAKATLFVDLLLKTSWLTNVRSCVLPCVMFRKKPLPTTPI